jgi:hypothetical protein
MGCFIDETPTQQLQHESVWSRQEQPQGLSPLAEASPSLELSTCVSETSQPVCHAPGGTDKERESGTWVQEWMSLGLGLAWLGLCRAATHERGQARCHAITRSPALIQACVSLCLQPQQDTPTAVPSGEFTPLPWSEAARMDMSGRGWSEFPSPPSTAMLKHRMARLAT